MPLLFCDTRGRIAVLPQPRPSNRCGHVAVAWSDPEPLAQLRKACEPMLQSREGRRWSSGFQPRGPQYGDPGTALIIQRVDDTHVFVSEDERVAVHPCIPQHVCHVVTHICPDRALSAVPQ